MITIRIDKPKTLNTPASCFISFKYDPNIVSVLRTLPFKHYDVDNKEWEMPLNKLEWLQEKLPDYEFDISGEVPEDDNEIVIPEGFEFKTKPFKHQEESFIYGLKYDRWFLGDEQGLGKTKQSLDIAIARKLKYGYKHCLIVCGVNTLKWNWLNEIKTHTNEQALILGQKERAGKITIGSTKDKLADLDFIQTMKGKDDLPYFLITNVESFRDENIATAVKNLCNNKIINMCIADELHKMKNPTSQQTKGFLKCLPECRIAMTGTPLMNNPLDLYVLLRWLGYENHAFYAFKKYYCVMGGFGGYEIIGYKNMEQLTNQLTEVMLRRKKEDVFDLPEKIYVDEIVEMTPKQEIIYREVETDIKANIDMVKFENNPLATLIRLRQATGYTGILSSDIKESAKLDRMEDLVDEAISTNQQVIIFSNWTQMTDVIQERLIRKYALCTITGDTKDNFRQAYIDDFQKGRYKIILGTIGALGTGVTLTAATVVIFLDEPWNRALFDQAVDRAHRIGTKSNITIYSIMCKGTIDERIHNIVYKKGLMSDAIVDGHIVGNKTEVFNYLIGG